MFDPNLPQADTEIDAVQMRGQLNGLKTLIDAVPTITSAQVDAVNTLPPGSPATVSASVVAGVLHFSFSIPEGMQGIPGPQGPPFANAIVDAVTTLAPGNPATVGVSFDGSFVHFTFGIPQGFQGDPGQQGETGPQGEVTTAALNAGLAAVTAGSSANSDTVPTLNTPFADPDAEALRQAYNDLVAALRR
jgi:hypothetical protein